MMEIMLAGFGRWRFLLALIPPLWFALMNPRVPAPPAGGAAQGETRAA